MVTALLIMILLGVMISYSFLSTELNLIKQEMAKTADELKQEFATVKAEIQDSIANVAADIDRLIEGTNPQGGLTEAEVEEQLSDLRGISSALKAAADKVVEPPDTEV